MLSQDKKEIDMVRLKFPKDQNKSSIIESLLLIQYANDGYLSEVMIEALADYLNIKKIDVYEVLHFTQCLISNQSKKCHLYVQMYHAC